MTITVAKHRAGKKRALTDEAKEDRRQLLLSAALDEFVENGFARARMDDIAKRAGLSKGTLYLYFDNKDAVFTSLVETLAIPNVERMEETIQQVPSFEAAFRAIMNIAPTMIRSSDVPRLMKVLIANSAIFPETVIAYREKVIDRVLAAVAGLLSRAQKNGEITIGDPLLTARLVVAPIAFSGIYHVLFGKHPQGQVDLDALFALHTDYILKALRPESDL